MRDTARKFVLGAMVLVLGGSWVAAEEIGPVFAPLDPMAIPEMRVGDTRTWVNKKGKESTTTAVAVDEATVTFEGDNGCTYTETHESFGRSLKWSNCGTWVTGSQTIRLVKGEVWPLTTGNKWRYKISGKNEKGKRWKTKRSCQVKKEVRVSVPAGDFDTYHVVCKEGYRKDQYYVSPEIKHIVMSRSSHGQGRFPSRTRKLVSVGSGNSE